MLPIHLAPIQETSRFFPHIFEAAFCGFAQEKHARSLEGTLVYSTLTYPSAQRSTGTTRK